MMEWPQEIVTAFERALEVSPAEGYDRGQVLRALFDETARRAVWRAQGDPQRLGPALRTPYTPLGSVVADCIDGRALSLTVKGEFWGQAVSALHSYAERNAPAVCAAFQDEMEPYDCDIGLG